MMDRTADIERIETLAALEALIEQSKERPVWILKHSLTCSISGSAWGEFQRFAARPSQPAEAVYAVIEIQNARPVSNALAELSGVRHQSPQALLLCDGRVTWHASHYDIHQTALERV
jgi:bacillithiol system protein YtxJ